MDAIERVFARHHRIGFQFSGGRDSTAALYWLRGLWPRMTVYHLDTGDQFPELRTVVDRVAQDVPIERIHTSAPYTRAVFGWPSDLVPVDNIEPGRALSGRTLPIISRFQCCSRVLMEPLHERMLADKVSLLVRGTRAEDFAGTPVIRSGFSDGVVEILHPIEDWPAAQVDAYLAAHNLPVAPFYAEGMTQAPACMGCTAWWGEGRLAYMRKHHPQALRRVQADIALIRAEIDHQYAMLDEENHHG